MNRKIKNGDLSIKLSSNDNLQEEIPSPTICVKDTIDAESQHYWMMIRDSILDKYGGTRIPPKISNRRTEND